MDGTQAKRNKRTSDRVVLRKMVFSCELQHVQSEENLLGRSFIFMKMTISAETLRTLQAEDIANLVLFIKLYSIYYSER